MGLTQRPQADTRLTQAKFFYAWFSRFCVLCQQGYFITIHPNPNALVFGVGLRRDI
ncbi:hypothetical protein VB854_11600 [Limnoraphis robusta CCNP1315]|uniref:Uncharacterized protein n=1 Tax=Limnoraphis robusta CCNP1315 TaxID=3110306 RepID=A0ABU5TXN6_9CYAN|nr:hypothetical protein [Limnoraphis robusta CCNP1315]MEA5549267.1 hypothetical protein [Limnoraphis robusta CCNP1324]